MTTCSLEEAWPAVEARLESGEVVSIAALLEDELGLAWTDPGIQEARAALIARLASDDRYIEVSPGRYLASGRVPAPPGQMRLPTVRVEHHEPILIEALEAWREARDEEGLSSFTRRLSFREISHGALWLGASAARLLANAPAMLTLRTEGQSYTIWYAREPRPMLYGLEDWIWCLDPGRYVRFTRVANDTLAVAVLDRFDEDFGRSESRLMDLDGLRRLRRFGMPYRDHVRVLLARHERGLTVRELIDALEAELGFRPHPPTIRSVLSSAPEFQVQAHRWRFEGSNGPAWCEEVEDAQRWYETEGPAYEERALYRGVLMSVGGSIEPLAFSLHHSRPEAICLIASQGTAALAEALLAELPFRPLRSRTVLVEDHEDLFKSLSASREGLQWLLQAGLRPQELLVDFTGGTKAMSSALVLATHTSGCAYSYVGGKRHKSGLGTVISGQERLRLVPSIGAGAGGL